MDEMINKLYVELSKVATVSTPRERELKRQIEERDYCIAAYRKRVLHLRSNLCRQ